MSAVTANTWGRFEDPRLGTFSEDSDRVEEQKRSKHVNTLSAVCRFYRGFTVFTASLAELIALGQHVRARILVHVGDMGFSRFFTFFFSAPASIKVRM